MNTFKTKGTCAGTINFNIDNNILTHVEFIGGCRGNAQGVSKLACNRNIDEVIQLLEGIQCRAGTSCPDQLAKALKEYKQK